MECQEKTYSGDSPILLNLKVLLQATDYKIKEYLEKTGLTEYFDMVLSSKDVKRGKPYPDIFLEICQKFDVKPEETLVLEDSSNGVQAALAGNLPVINVPDLLPIPEEQQEKCVAVVSDLVQVIPLLDLKK